MNRDRSSRRFPVIMSMIFGLMLTIMPLPDAAEAFRPDWLALLVIFWAVFTPVSTNIFASAAWHGMRGVLLCAVRCVR